MDHMPYEYIPLLKAMMVTTVIWVGSWNGVWSRLALSWILIEVLDTMGITILINACTVHNTQEW